MLDYTIKAACRRYNFTENVMRPEEVLGKCDQVNTLDDAKSIITNSLVWCLILKPWGLASF